MDLQKVGTFLKELRKENDLTQEQLAEQFNVTRRTVSRWETGSNMPDIDILVELSDFYRVDLREILSGERKAEKMDKKTEETVYRAVDYTSTQNEKHNRKVNTVLLIGALCYLVSGIIKHTALMDISVFSHISDFAQGTACGLIVLGIILNTRYGARIREFKQRILRKE